MNIDIMKKDVDSFIQEIFYGFSTINKDNLGYSKFPLIIPITGVDPKDDNMNMLVLMAELFSNIRKYISGNSDENMIKNIYTSVMGLRSIGAIVNNNDSISSLKMEKKRADDRSLDLEKKNDILSEELLNCRSILDSKKMNVEAIK